MARAMLTMIVMIMLMRMVAILIHTLNPILPLDLTIATLDASSEPEHATSLKHVFVGKRSFPKSLLRTGKGITSKPFGE